MNVELKVYGRSGEVITTDASKPGIPAVAGAIFRMHQWVTQHIAVTMRTFSISHIALTLDNVGVMPVSNIAFKPLDDENLPAAAKVLRAKVVRETLRSMLECFGIQAVTIKLTDAEMVELRAYWRYLSTGEVSPGLGVPAQQRADDNLPQDDSKFQHVALNVDTDPTQQAAAPAGPQAPG